MMQVKTYEEIYGEKLRIKDLVEGFDEDTKTGKVTAYAGKLICRPPYQREFIYENAKQQAVIETVMKGLPLNVMYWAKTDEDRFELMDGQQRTLSICKFHDVQQVVPVYENGKIRNLNFDEFDDAQTKAFLEYPLTIYICDGTEEEKLAWFRIINIAGVKLTEQEMRNAIYSSPWVSDAKKYFSDVKGEGYLSDGHLSNGQIYGNYVNVVGGSNSEKENAVCRQKLLEIVLGWATDKYNRENDRKDKINIDDFMRINKTNANARELWRYYEDVMEWVKETFSTYRSEMKGVDWGILYNKYHENTPENANEIADSIFKNASDEISNKKGVYEAVLSKNIKYIHARTFDKRDMDWAYNKQKGICPYCHNHFPREAMQGDHIKPWSKGGVTERDNLQMLCADCNGKKSGYDTQYNPWEDTEYVPFNIEEWDKGSKHENTVLKQTNMHENAKSEQDGTLVNPLISAMNPPVYED